MDINNLEELKVHFADFKELFAQGKAEKAADLLEELLCALEEQVHVRKAGSVDKRGNITAGIAGEADPTIYMSLNHVMEYYIYAYYFHPEAAVEQTALPYGEYYRTYAELCMQLQRYRAAEAAYKSAIAWNPVDLDAILGLAEAYKYLNMLERYCSVSRQAYRYCCTRATMARYYRNMGYYYLAKYEPAVARACYIYSNIYYHTENADNELKYLETALQEKTPKPDIREMQKIFDENKIEPGPESDTIGVVYRVGELMMQDKEYKLARDCFSIVYDITQEEALAVLLKELGDEEI